MEEKNEVQNDVQNNVQNGAQFETTTQTGPVVDQKPKSKKSKMIIAIIAVVIILFAVAGGQENTENTGNDEDKGNSNPITSIFNKPETLEINRTATVGNSCELTIINNKITQRIDPPSATGYYHYFEADEGKTYLDVIADVKNTSQASVKQDSLFSAKAYVDGSEYTCKLIVEEDNGADLSGYTSLYDIEPLETLKYHIAVQIPSASLVSGKTIELKLSANDKEYVYTIRIIDDENNQEKNTSTINLSQPTQKIALNQTLKVDNICEVTLVKVNLVSRINPPAASGYYHYYQADDGKVYFDLVADVKNLKTSAVEQDSVLGRVKLIYDGSYEYSCSFIVEEDNGKDLNGYTNLYDIDPLETMRYHISTQVPQEVQNSQGSLEVIFNIGGEEYSFQAR